jgi:hypothetical protein
VNVFACVVLPCVLWAEDAPLTLDYVLARAKTPIARLNADATLAEGRRQLKDASAFLRESPSVAVSAGPRTGHVIGSTGHLPSTMDQTVEIDAPLMLNRGPARRLASQLGAAAPLMQGAADVESRLEIHKAFLDAWAAERIEAISAEDNLLVREWLAIAKARSESGADPAFQLDLVKGELHKSHLDTEEAKRARVQAWASLVALSDLPKAPQQLEYRQGGAAGAMGRDVAESETRYRNGLLRRAATAKQGLEAGQINLQATQSNSRFSLSGSYANEINEHVAKIGVSYRLPRLGEVSAIKAERRAQLDASARDLELALAELDLRFASAMQTIESNKDYPKAPDTAASLEALTLRLREGKDRPSEAIPVRRQFLEIRIRELQRVHALCLAQAELSALTADAAPQ